MINGVWLLIQRELLGGEVTAILFCSRDDGAIRKEARHLNKVGLEDFFYTVEFVPDLEEIDRCRLPEARDTVVVETLKEGEWKPL